MDKKNEVIEGFVRDFYEKSLQTDRASFIAFLWHSLENEPEKYCYPLSDFIDSYNNFDGEQLTKELVLEKYKDFVGKCFKWKNPNSDGTELVHFLPSEEQVCKFEPNRGAQFQKLKAEIIYYGDSYMNPSYKDISYEEDEISFFHDIRGMKDVKEIDYTAFEKVKSLVLESVKLVENIEYQHTINREYVDLGLPSGLLWAKCNIGASKPEEAGLYFQWGDIQGYTAEQVGTDKKFASDFSDYRFGTLSNFTKYNSSNSKIVLDPEDDAAHVLMGGNWRIPTQEDFYELIQNTDIVLVKTDGEEETVSVMESCGTWGFTFTAVETANVVKFYRKDDHSKFIFVPASGSASAGSVEGVGVFGLLWSSSLNPSDVNRAWYFGFDAPYDYGIVGDGVRYYGYPLRGVRPK